MQKAQHLIVQALSDDEDCCGAVSYELNMGIPLNGFCIEFGDFITVPTTLTDATSRSISEPPPVGLKIHKASETLSHQLSTVNSTTTDEKVVEAASSSACCFDDNENNTTEVSLNEDKLQFCYNTSITSEQLQAEYASVIAK